MAAGGRNRVESVFTVALLVVLAGMLVAHVMTGTEAYLTIAFVLIVVGWPIEWYFNRARKHRSLSGG